MTTEPEPVELTATVQTIRIGTRSLTKAIIDQLDDVGGRDIEPWGRVRIAQPRRAHPAWTIIGRHRVTGQLVRCRVPMPWPQSPPGSPAEVAYNAVEALPLIILGGLR